MEEVASASASIAGAFVTGMGLIVCFSVVARLLRRDVA